MEWSDRLVARSAVEVTADRAFAQRVARLSIVSALMVGAIWAAARASGPVHPAIAYLLASGWILMPIVLSASLRWPRLRYALVAPATLITIGVAATFATVGSLDARATAGWALVTSGVVLGDVLGVWFWFRLFPVPSALDDPFSRGRWALVGLHVALVVSGLVVLGVHVAGLPATRRLASENPNASRLFALAAFPSGRQADTPRFTTPGPAGIPRSSSSAAAGTGAPGTLRESRSPSD